MPNPRKVTPEIKAFMLEQREAGKSFGKITRLIQARFNVKLSESAISWHCLINGADSPRTERKLLPQTAPGPVSYDRGAGHMVRRFTPEEDQRMQVMDRSGMSRAAIARELGRRPNSILGRLATLARQDLRRDGKIGENS